MQDVINMSSSLLHSYFNPHDGIVFNHIIMFHVQNEIEQMLFRSQWLPKNAMWFPCGLHMNNNGWDHKLRQFFKFFHSEIGESFKHT
jgi:hypothetical protein